MAIVSVGHKDKDISSNQKTGRLKRQKVPYPDQIKAVVEIVKGFEHADRGQIERACGTGKTLIGQLVSEELQSRFTIVLVPSLALLAQTLTSWRGQSKEELTILAVCSDSSVSKNTQHDVEQNDDISLEDLKLQHVEVTTSKAVIIDFIAASCPSSKRVIFTTYQSCNEVIDALNVQNVVADLAIADEAHLIASESPTDESGFRAALNIRAKKFLFMTATPRLYDAVDERNRDTAEIISMDDTKRFGEVLHRYSFTQAIADDRLTDYEVLVIGIRESVLAKQLKDKELKGNHATAEILLAGQLALLRAVEERDVYSVIAFLNRVSRAADFARPGGETSLQEIAESSGYREKLRTEGKISSIKVNYVSGVMRASERRNKLSELSSARDKGEICVTANCACLGLGIDIPTLDAVLMIDPRKSKIEATQIVGRVVRKDPSARKKKGVIIVPVVVTENESAEAALSHSSFKAFYDVLRALRSHDPRLGNILDSMHRAIASGNVSEVDKMRERLSKNIKILLPHSEKESPHDKELMQRLTNAIYLKAVSTVGLKEEIDERKVLSWSKTHFERELDLYLKDPEHTALPSWPTATSGQVAEAPEWNWGTIDYLLRFGGRNFTATGRGIGGLLEKHCLTRLATDDILLWSKSYYQRSLKSYLEDPLNNIPPTWPYSLTPGRVLEAPQWTWRVIDQSIYEGRNGLKPIGTGLSGLLEQHQLTTLSEEKILVWCKGCYQRRVDHYFQDPENHQRPAWPDRFSGRVAEAPEWSWSVVDQALYKGKYGLEATGTGIGGLLSKHQLNILTEEKILFWCKTYYSKTLKLYLIDPINHPCPSFPYVTTNDVVYEAPEWSWKDIDSALRHGQHGIKVGGSSLSRLLKIHSERLKTECENELKEASKDFTNSVDSSNSALLSSPRDPVVLINTITREQVQTLHAKQLVEQIKNVTRGILTGETPSTLTHVHAGFTESQSLMVIGKGRIENNFYVQIGRARRSSDWDLLAPEYQRRIFGMTPHIVTAATLRALCAKYGTPRTLLSVGSGPGVLYECVKLAGMSIEVCDLDKSPKMIEASKNPNKKIGDAQSLDYPQGRFDCVECSSVFRLGDSDDIERFLRSAYRVLEHEGILWLKADGVKFSESFISNTQALGFKLLGFPNSSVEISSEIIVNLSPELRARVLRSISNSSLLIFSKRVVPEEALQKGGFTYLRRATSSEVSNKFATIITRSATTNALGELDHESSREFLTTLCDFRHIVSALSEGEKHTHRAVALQLCELYARCIFLQHEVPHLSRALDEDGLKKDSVALKKILARECNTLISKFGQEDSLARILNSLHGAISDVLEWK